MIDEEIYVIEIFILYTVIYDVIKHNMRQKCNITFIFLLILGHPLVI